MSTTVQQLLNEAIGQLGGYDVYASAGSAELTDAMNTFNFLRSSWSSDEDILPKTSESFTVSAAVDNYSWVASGDFNSSRPIKVVRAYVNVGGLDTPVKPIGKDQYNRILQKATTGIPEVLYYDKGYATGNIYLYPVPAASGTLYVDSLKELSAFTALSATISESGEMLEAYVWNLSIRLAPKYGKQVTPEMVAMARESLNRVKRAKSEDTVSLPPDSNFML